MRVICYGDSNTYGFDPRDYFGGRYAAGDRWPELLAKRTGWDVINQGVNGREIPRGAVPVQLLDAYAPVNAFLVMLGTNDLLQGASAGEAAARMEAFLTSLVPYCRNALLVSPPPMARGAWVPNDDLVAESLQLSEEYQGLAEKLHIPFVGTRDWDIELCFDGVHFTENGHHKFAELLYRDLSCLELSDNRG